MRGERITKGVQGNLLDVDTLSKFLGVCKMTVYRSIKKRGGLPVHRLGSKYLFFKDEVERWLRER